MPIDYESWEVSVRDLATNQAYPVGWYAATRLTRAIVRRHLRGHCTPLRGKSAPAVRGGIREALTDGAQVGWSGARAPCTLVGWFCVAASYKARSLRWSGAGAPRRGCRPGGASRGSVGRARSRRRGVTSS